MESLVAVGVPTVLLIVLLLLPFFDRRSERSFRRRPVAMASLGGITAACAVLFGSAAREAPTGAPEVGRPLTSVERAGRTLFDQQQCGGCHLVKGLEAVKKNEDAPEDTPELTEVGLKHSAAWMHSFMEDPVRFHADSKMPAFGPPTLTHQEIEELAQYLASLRGPDGATKQPEYRDTFPEPLKSKEKP
jgi:mono/diheme cytochrome c family protein